MVKFIGFITILTIAGVELTSCGRDSTDSPTQRSGLVLYTDYGTGVQYVSSGWFGGIAVRVDRDGKPVTVK